MTFSSIVFLYFFLPVFLGIYAIVPPKHRAVVLTLGSCFFIVWKAPLGLINLAVSVITAYFGGILIHNFRESKVKRVTLLVVSIVLNAAMLVIFNTTLYNNTGIMSYIMRNSDRNGWLVAFGVAVYTLHSISYCVDVFRGEIQPQTRFFVLCSYVGFLPVLNCGPILKFSDIGQTLETPRITTEKLSDGIMYFLRGLAEKVVFANMLSSFFRDIYSIGTDKMSMITAWLGMIVFGLWIYYELLGFSHMARGFALMLGFELPKNFDLPYSKTSVKDFSISFNCSLNRWLDSYIFQPLGGAKVSSIMLVGSMFVVALANGLWYGVSMNIIVWSFYIAAVLLIGRFLKKPLSHLPIVFRYIITNVLVFFGWAFFSMKSLDASFSYIRALFRGGDMLGDSLLWYFISSFGLVIFIAILFSSPLFDWVYKKLDEINSSIFSIAKPAIILALLLVCTAFMSAGGTVSLFAF